MMNPAEFANIAQAEDRFWWYRGMRQILFRILDPIARRRSTGRVLEAGCGTGYFALRLKERYGWKIFPVDLSREGLEHALRLGVERPAQADICALPFPDQSMDALISMDVLVHLPLGREREAMREFSRTLKRGGLFVIRVSAFNILRSHHSQFAMERQRFTRSRLTQLAEANGIKVLRCTYANSFLLPVALAKFRIIEPLSGRKPTSGVEPISPLFDTLLHFPLNIESRLLGAGLNFPVGQSLILVGEKS
jgi:SAM-dependent methyltransferase